MNDMMVRNERWCVAHAIDPARPIIAELSVGVANARIARQVAYRCTEGEKKNIAESEEYFSIQL